ncbi:MAG: Na+/H+ antiporter NhaA, partial [Propionibacteriaceae bacterium]|nr:Na+/H+ antiporter NhaA [Propionibacteriaceae bacterium]
MSPTQSPQTTLARGSWRESLRVAKILEKETASGALLLLAAVIAMTVANLAPEAYFGLRDFELVNANIFGMPLELTVGHFAADGL